MGTRIDSSPQRLVGVTRDQLSTERAKQSDHGVDDRLAARARHQQFGLLILGGILCLAAIVFARWDAQEQTGRWFWLTIATATSVVCLMRSQRRHGGIGADRDASPYYGIFAGVTSGAVLLMLLTVEGWVLLGVLFTMAGVLAFMAWIEQSAIGMTAALCVSVLAAGYGVSVLNDPASTTLGSLAIGVMLMVGAAALTPIDRGSEVNTGGVATDEQSLSTWG